ncbi:MAG: insulinase family protein [Candidatus Liptonbacteria bacterium]|nr:insulinase family protein [Candidatus Liptonbacteria bacterium]
MKEVKTGVLKNGFRFYSFFDPNVHLCGVGVKAGLIHDPEDARGMAHGVEHHVCRETESHNAREIELIFRELDCGPHGSIKIQTTDTSTFFGTDMLMYRKHMQKLFPVFASIVKEPLMTEAGWKSEKGAIFVEYLHGGKDSLEDEVSIYLHQLVYERNPIRNRLDCELDDLKRLGVERVRAFKKAHYVANNMFALIFGPKFSEARRMAEEHFGNLPMVEIPKLNYDFSDSRPVLTGVKHHSVHRPGFNVHHVGMGFPLSPITPDDGEDVALEVLKEVLEYRIEEVLRGKNRAWDKGTYHPRVRINRSFVHGLFCVWWPTPSMESVEMGEGLVIRECERIKGNGFIEAEIERAVESVAESNRVERRRRLVRRYKAELNEEVKRLRQGILNHHRSQYSMMLGGLAEMVIEAATNGDEELKGLNSYSRRLIGVTRSKVVEIANKYLTTDAYARVVIHPMELPQSELAPVVTP